MREWMREPEDERPIIGQCAICGCDIHDESPGYYADKYYDFEWMGELVCDTGNCLQEYCNNHFAKGD